MRLRAFLAGAALLFAPISAPPAAGHGPQPYAGQQERGIKGISDDEIAQYLAGAGMGYAKAAELNRYPGPMHVLELADRLPLTPAQRESTATLMQAHKAEARVLGAKVVQAERALDGLFRSGSATQEELAAQVRAVAVARGEYRLSHLETHRRMRALLTSEQIGRYDVLRGYGPAAASHTHAH